MGPTPVLTSSTSCSHSPNYIRCNLNQHKHNQLHQLWACTKWERTEVQLKRRKWSWTGHALRTTKQALTWNLQGKRGRGRSKTPEERAQSKSLRKTGWRGNSWRRWLKTDEDGNCSSIAYVPWGTQMSKSVHMCFSTNIKVDHVRIVRHFEQIWLSLNSVPSWDVFLCTIDTFGDADGVIPLLDGLKFIQL